MQHAASLPRVYAAPSLYVFQRPPPGQNPGCALFPSSRRASPRAQGRCSRDKGLALFSACLKRVSSLTYALQGARACLPVLRPLRGTRGLATGWVALKAAQRLAAECSGAKNGSHDDVGEPEVLLQCSLRSEACRARARQPTERFWTSAFRCSSSRGDTGGGVQAGDSPFLPWHTQGLRESHCRQVHGNLGKPPGAAERILPAAGYG